MANKTKTVLLIGTSHRHADSNGLYGHTFAKIEYDNDPQFKDNVVVLLEMLSKAKFTHVDQDLEAEGFIMGNHDSSSKWYSHRLIDVNNNKRYY